MHISFHNTTKADKTDGEFMRNEQYKSTGIPYETKDGMFYKEILLKVIPEKLKQLPIDDLVLSEKESKEIEIPFSNFILTLLAKRDQEIEEDADIEFLGKIYKLQTRSEDRGIWLYIRMYRLLKECLLENKPLYMSLSKDAIDT